ncbi:MAG: alanine--tRNA ligase-related protein [Candidatus Micrarchaeia archaeon]
MATEKVYLKDMYAKELEAKIEKAEGNKLILDKTIFYPGGGGQPPDTGTVELNGKKLGVIGMEKDQDNIVHILEAPIDAAPGSVVKLAIDWEKRYMYMRYHTALHVIDGVITKNYKADVVATSSQIYEDRARLGFDMPELNKALAAKIVEEADKVAKGGHKVSAREVPREEALKMENLARTEPGKKLIQNLDYVRIVEIEGVDLQADGGTHVADTKEIGTITLLKFENKGAHDKNIEIKIA